MIMRLGVFETIYGAGAEMNIPRALLISVVGFLIVFNCYPVIQKFVINPYYAQRGELSPEMGFSETSGENVFEDQGGKETPVEPKKKGKKGKLIS